MGIIQEMIENIHLYKNDKYEYIKRCKEILENLLRSNNIYTIMSRKSSESELLAGTGKIFCGINESNNPCVWLFSEERYAVDYAEHFGFKHNQYHLVRKVPKEELIEVIYNAMFKGVKTIRIDEGQTYLNCSIYDFVDVSLEVMGREAIIKDEEKNCFTLFSNSRYKGHLIYLYEEPMANINIDNALQVIPLINNRVLKIFVTEDDARLGLQYPTVGTLKSLSYEGFKELISRLVLEGNVDYVEFNTKNNQSKMNLKKANMILNKMQ